MAKTTEEAIGKAYDALFAAAAGISLWTLFWSTLHLEGRKKRTAKEVLELGREVEVRLETLLSSLRSYLEVFESKIPR